MASVFLFSSCASGYDIYYRLYVAPKEQQKKQQERQDQQEQQKIIEIEKQKQHAKMKKEKEQIEIAKVAPSYIEFVNTNSESLQKELGENEIFENTDSYVRWLRTKKNLFQEMLKNKSYLGQSKEFLYIPKISVLIRDSIAELLYTSCSISNREYVKLFNQETPERKQLYEELCSIESEINIIFKEMFDSYYQYEVTTFKDYLAKNYNRKVNESDFSTYQIEESKDFEGKLLKNYYTNTIIDGSFYKLAFGNVFQSIENGFLLYYSFEAINHEYLFFVESDKFYPEGYKFYNIWGNEQSLILQADGLFTYQSLAGSKRVYKFKAIELDRQYTTLFGANAYLFSELLSPYTPDPFQ
jgi:hypothetical protein